MQVVGPQHGDVAARAPWRCWRLDVLQAMGCDHGRGHPIARPMPVDELSGWLSHRCVG